MNTTHTRSLSSLLAAPNAAATESRTGANAPMPGMDFASLMGARVQAAQSAQASTAQQQHAAPADTAHNNSAAKPSPDTNRALNERRERERLHERTSEQRAQQAAAAARQQTARSSGTQQQAAKPAAAETQEAQGRDENEATADDKQVATTPLAEWLASLNPATMVAQPEAAEGSTEGDLAVGTKDLSTDGGAPQRNTTGLRRSGASAAGADSGAAAAANRPAGTDARFELPAAAGAAEQAQALAGTPAATRTETTSVAAKTGAEALAGVTDLTATNTRQSEAPAPAAVDVPTPTADPDFPDVFATQVSVLVKDGVQQAELHLNPAEMGPIAVQIAVDGSQAQVDFAAATGATRELIETSLPMLAAALHEAGLTLAGGGVFEHGRHARNAGQGDAQSSSQSQRGGQRGGPGQGSSGIEGATATQSVARRVAVRGAVDLYA